MTAWLESRLKKSLKSYTTFKALVSGCVAVSGSQTGNEAMLSSARLDEADCHQVKPCGPGSRSWN